MFSSKIYGETREDDLEHPLLSKSNMRNFIRINFKNNLFILRLTFLTSPEDGRPTDQINKPLVSQYRIFDCKQRKRE